jgi:hypothetical protein
MFHIGVSYELTAYKAVARLRLLLNKEFFYEFLPLSCRTGFHFFLDKKTKQKNQGRPNPSGWAATPPHSRSKGRTLISIF